MDHHLNCFPVTIKAQMEEIKEERAAMKVHTPDNKASKVDWKELAIQNALNKK